MKILLKIGILLFALTPMSAQPLDEIVGLAIDRNPTLQSLKNSFQAQLEVAPQVAQLPDPELSLGWFPLPVETRLGAQNVRLGWTQSFPWKGTLAARKAIANAAANVTHQQIARQQLQLIVELEQAYYQLYALRSKAVALDSSLQIFEALKELSLAKVAAGKATNADVLRVQLKINTIRQEQQRLRLAAIDPQSVINRLVSRESERQVATPEVLVFCELPYQKDSLLAFAKKNHPDIQYLAAQQNLASQQLALNEVSRKPSFGVGADYIQVSQRTDADPFHNGRDIFLLRAGIKIPINGKRFDARDREEKLKIAALEDQKTAQYDQYAMVVERGFNRYEQAQLDYQFYQEQQSVLQSVIAILVSQYSSQGTGLEEILQLQEEQIRYGLKIIEAIQESYIAKSQLDQFLVLF